ncbi:MAG: iron-sulfur protein [Treponema sp.]|jgi:epoxyqueuosine reductase|nr:iron-sulfur protein [Treponema sp.]
MELKKTITALTLAAGFVRCRILAPFDPPPETGNYGQGAPSLLMAALPYGNQTAPADTGPPRRGGYGRIAPFAQRNYYREGVKRLQRTGAELRSRFGGRRSSFRILCNSPLPEKPLAQACGLGILGRNSLLITPEAGSLIIIAAMTLPYDLAADPPLTPDDFSGCGSCGARAPCTAACPAGALEKQGAVDRLRCIQWYASGKEHAIPAGVAARWGNRLYGCTACQDACPHNRRPIPGTACQEGVLPAYMDCRELLALDDPALKARFKGSALGQSWLGIEAIRRNARLALLFRGPGTDLVDNGGLNGV